jgi:hypothetical protein
MAFTPSDNSRASILLAYVVSEMKEAGHTISYDDIATLIELEYADVSEVVTTISGVIATVNKRLARNGDWRHLFNIPNVGYRIAYPSDLRAEVVARHDHMVKTHNAAVRATNKAIIHPDSSAAERRQATDTLALQDSLATIMRKHNRQSRVTWPSSERPAVTAEMLDDDQVA